MIRSQVGPQTVQYKTPTLPGFVVPFPFMMDLNAVNYNVTIDDFDSILTYSDQASWRTPDPSSFNYNSSRWPWLRGTYHNTSVIDASVTLNFTGPAIYVYGTFGPAYGCYEVRLDNQTPEVYRSFSKRVYTGPQLMYSNSTLTYGNHRIVLRNLGDTYIHETGNAFLLDYIQTTIQLAPQGANVTNVTYEETSPVIKYNGTWINSLGSPFFSGGGSKYTNADGASFELTFQGSAVYVLGEKKNDHRGYTVTLDSKTYHYNGTSGCGGAFGLTCEEQRPCLKFLASNLAAGNHSLKLVNNANGSAQTGPSFFDLDSIVITVPSRYAPRKLNSAAPNALPMSLLLLVVTVILLLRLLVGKRTMT